MIDPGYLRGIYGASKLLMSHAAGEDKGKIG